VAALLAALTGALPTDVCGRGTGAIEKSEKSDFKLCGRQESYVQEGKPTWLPCSQPLLGPFPLTCAAGALVQLKKSDFNYVGDKDVQEGKPTWLPCSQPLLGPFPLTCAAGALVRLKKVKKVILNYAGDKRVMFKKENLRGCLARCPFWGPSH